MDGEKGKGGGKERKRARWMKEERERERERERGEREECDAGYRPAGREAILALVAEIRWRQREKKIFNPESRK